MKLIIESKKNRITFFGGLVTWLFAMAISYLVFPVVVDNFTESWQGIVMGAIILTGEKLVTWVMYTFRVEEILAFAGDYILRNIKRIGK